MRTTGLVALTAVALVVGLVAPASAAEVELTDAQLADAVLAPADVPDAGWESAPPDVIEPEPHTQANDIEGGWCGGATDGYTAGELRAGGSARATLTKVVSPDEPRWFIWETLWSFRESAGTTAVGSAKAFLATTRAVVEECPSWIDDNGEFLSTLTPEVVTFPRVGKKRLAFRVTTATEDFSNEASVVYVRVANQVAVIHTRILPPDSTLLTKIVKRAVRKLRAAAAAV
jgi:hypothetical protein